ncbi:MAG: tRNA 2-thiouridine(34) synthase MnmA [Patescibacteria group bacterium]
MAKEKVVVAMSGGVDSSVAAALLKKQDYEVVGVFMQFWFPLSRQGQAEAGSFTKNKTIQSSINTKVYEENRCCSLRSWNEAQQVARILDFPVRKVNFGRQFKKLIVDEFLREYRLGRTPNPCVACNKFIKFDLLLKYARTVFGADYLATGHYASLVSFKLGRPKDRQKDQTYFLYNLKQAQLKHLLFPLGNYTKNEVRKLAKKFKLPVFDKPDSQEICFVGQSHYDFLKKYLRLQPGKIISNQGKILRTHQGLPLYTLGQRSGLGLSGGPWYVAEMDYKKNRLVVTKKEKQSAIFRKELVAQKVNWLFGEPKFPLICQAQIRYHARSASCLVKKQDQKIVVEFRQKQRAIMPGQSVVFYQGDELLGGGVIVG